MALEVWFQDNIGRVLNGLITAHARTARGLPCTAENTAYQAGFRDALTAVAAAFGLSSAPLPDEGPTVQAFFGDDSGSVLGRSAFSAATLSGLSDRSSNLTSRVVQCIIWIA